MNDFCRLDNNRIKIGYARLFLEKALESMACSMFDNIHKTCLEIDKFAANMKGHV